MHASLDGLPIDEILAIARRNGATSVSVFGSRARGDGRPDSDLDLLIEIAPRTSLFDLGRMYVELNELLDIEVDVVTVGSLRPQVRDEILREARPLVVAA
jgi:predicted nucleotidyltransferase